MFESAPKFIGVKVAHFKSLILVIVISVFALPVMAEAPFFSNLTDSDVEDIIKDFAAVEAFTSVSPASTLGDVFGIEAGVIVGAAKVPNIEDLVHRADATKDVPALPQASIFGAVSIPFGIKFEGAFLPEQDVSGVKLKYGALAAQYTLTKDLLPLPLDLAIKLHATKASLEYDQLVSAVLTTVEIDDTITGVQVIASKDLVIAEPYVGVGFLRTKGEFSAVAAIFDGNSSNSIEKTVTGSQLFVGVNFKILVIKIGLEVGKVYDSTKANFKLSAAF